MFFLILVLEPKNARNMDNAVQHQLVSALSTLIENKEISSVGLSSAVNFGGSKYYVSLLIEL
jgi:hypothetical protein